MSSLGAGTDKEKADILVTELNELCNTHRVGKIAEQLRYCRSLLKKGVYWGYPSILSMINGFIDLAQNDEDRQVVFDALEELVVLASILPPIDEWEPLHELREAEKKESET